MGHVVKILGEEGDAYTVGGYGVVWGGRDLAGEHFTRETDFWFDRLTETPPVLYQHGMERATGTAVLGKVVSRKTDDTGLWIEAQIAKAAEYAEAVMELVRQGVLGWSSGSVEHLARIERGGKIVSWPVVEFSLTPTPCEPRTLGVAELATMASATPTLKAVLDQIKALPEPPAVDGPAGGAPAGSYEARQSALGHALGEMFDDQGVVIHATFPDYVIVCVWDEGDDERGPWHPTYYQVGYTLTLDGMPELGEARPLERRYVALPAIDTGPLTMRAAGLIDHAESFRAYTQGLADRRVKEGRVLSSANRQRLASCADAMETALVELRDLLAATDSSQPRDASPPAEAKAVDVDRLRAELELLLLTEPDAA